MTLMRELIAHELRQNAMDSGSAVGKTASFFRCPSELQETVLPKAGMHGKTDKHKGLPWRPSLRAALQQLEAPGPHSKGGNSDTPLWSVLPCQGIRLPSNHAK
ncbi:hypothetical protein B0H14DRAFT_2612260 [Mycena olivaceomarginata]|nr:hypothetical protein B0H14DRAFT_2612260 [Mycena olivaceomarginata]